MNRFPKLEEWKFYAHYDDEFILFKSLEDARCHFVGGDPGHIQVDVVIGITSTWAEFAPGWSSELYRHEEDAIYDDRDIVPYETRELFDIWLATLTRVECT